MYKKIILITVITIELSIGVIFLWRQYQARMLENSRVLGAESVAVLDRDSFAQPTDVPFKYFYESKPGTIQEATLSWLNPAPVYTINEDGLNDTKNYQVEKPAQTFRIIALGDSFTFGQWVNTAESWPEVLEQLLKDQPLCEHRNVEVLNLGEAGYDIPYIVERFNRVGKKYNPDMILWLESGSGFTRYKEGMQPIIDSCAAEQLSPSSSDSADLVAIPDDQKKKIYDSCWRKAQVLVQERNDVSAILTHYLDNFFEEVDQSEVWYFAFKDLFDKDTSEQLYAFWNQRYPQAHFSRLNFNLTATEKLPDGHPSVAGQKKIAHAMYDQLRAKRDTIGLCK